MHIVLARTDNIGDMLLSFPVAARIKKIHPDYKISVIAREYVRELVKACPDIDQFIAYESLLELGDVAAGERLKQQHIDSIILMRPEASLLKWAKLAKIPHRTAILKKYFYYSRKAWWGKILNINYGSKAKPLHFGQRCMLFLKALGLPHQVEREELNDLIHLNIKEFPELKTYLDSERFNLVVHAGTNNNTIEWPQEHLISLLKSLPEKTNVLLTGSESEAEKFRALINCHPHTQALFGKLNLPELMYLLQQADGVLANGTGPLHLSAALGTKTLGLYPAQVTINPVRWGPIGKQTGTLVAPHCELSLNKKRCGCMSKILPEHVLTYMQTNWF